MNSPIDDKFAKLIVLLGDGETHASPAQVIEKIGPPNDEIEQQPRRLFVPLFITSPLLLIAMTFLWFGIKATLDKTEKFTTLGIFMTLLGIAFIIWCLYLRRRIFRKSNHIVFFCRDGFYWSLGKAAGAWRWNAVVSVEENIVNVERLIIHFPIVHVSRSTKIDYFIENADGALLHFENDKFKDASRFHEILERECIARKIRYEIIRNSQRRMCAQRASSISPLQGF